MARRDTTFFLFFRVERAEIKWLADYVTSMSLNKKVRKIGFQNRNGNTINTTSFSASPSLTTNYNLTLPPTLPVTGLQALFADSTGALSWNATLTAGVTNTFTGANNVINATNVTGLILSTTSFATATVFVSINATTNQTAVFNLTTTFNAAGAYTLTYYSQGDDTGIVFTVNPTTAQVLYTSPSIAGFVALSMSWVTPKVITSYVPSSVTSVYAAASPQAVVAPVTGLVITTTFVTVSVQITVSATTSLTQVVDLKIYTKVGANNYALVQSSDGDDTGILFSVVTTTGQVQYTSPSFAGWTATTMQWVNPPTLTTTPTVLSSLSITSGSFQVLNGSTTLGPSAGGAMPTAALSSTSGSILTIPSGTIQDTSTIVNGTLSSYSSLYVGAPTLSALNTGVVTTTASTVTIAGPPLAGTNETITNAFALSVTGTSVFNGLFSSTTMPQYPAGHVYLVATTQVQVAAQSHYPYRFNPAAILVEGAPWYNPAMWSNNGSVFTPGFKGVFTFVWTQYQITPFEIAIGKNVIGDPAFSNTNGNSLAIGSNTNGPNGTTSYIYDLTTVAKFTSNNATDYAYFGLYNCSTSAQTPSSQRGALRIVLDHLI